VSTDGIVAGLLAILLFGEALTLFKLSSFMLALFGIAIISFGFNLKGLPVLVSKPAVLAWFSAFSFGLGFVLSKLLSNAISPVSATVYYFATSAILLFFYLAATRKFEFISASQAKVVFPSGFLSTIAFFSYFKAIETLPASIATPIGALGSAAFLLLLASVFLKEKLFDREKVGIAFIAASILLLSL